MRLLWLVPALFFGLQTAALAQAPVVTSAVPDSVAVTFYRDPTRGENEIDRGNPRAFALIAETRTVILPPGQAIVRFEGVASGIVPQSAILFGPSPKERNREAALLSQKGLVDAFTGQRATLRRTDPVTGKTVEEAVTVRSAADRLVVTTPRGAEALYCSGLKQTLIYPNAPAALSAKPVLTMTTQDQPGGRVTIKLAYIATGFDWDATYVATLAQDGTSLNLLGWLTLASADDTSFADATTSAVAGKVNRSEETRDDIGGQLRYEAESLDRLNDCWPAGTTSDIAFNQVVRELTAPAPMQMTLGGGDIIVTAQRRVEQFQNVPLSVSVVAKAENLGDLKLYRIPMSVTVAARSQKQVAFLVKEQVKGMLVYRAQMQWGEPGDIQMLFRFQNRKKDGLGDPLPAGKAVLYQGSQRGRMYLGEANVADKTVEEEVEWVFGEANNVTLDHDEENEKSGNATQNVITVNNANPFPIHFEMDFASGTNWVYRRFDARMTDKPGKRVWSTTIPANASIPLRFKSIDRERASE